jgi:23S rRNA pseudouridine2605 synthase
MRVQKYLARSGVGSRRKCESLVAEGRVSIEGKGTCELGSRVEEGDRVIIDDRIIEPLEKRYFIINKPGGYVSVNRDQRGRKWVVDLVPEGRKMGLFPVGRLDMETTGLMILTNDGDISHEISHPSNMIRKEYEALIKGTWTQIELSRLLKSGVNIGDDRPVKDIRIISATLEDRRTRVTLSIHEGRKHVVRRIFHAIGSRVYELERLAIGGLRSEGLPVGGYREIEEGEIRSAVTQSI